MSKELMDDLACHWISVEDKQPPNCETVLCRMSWRHNPKKTVTFTGYYARQWEMETSPYVEGACEYHEEKDTYFLPEGWYENQWNWDDYASITVNEGKVIEWMPIPPTTKSQGEKA